MSTRFSPLGLVGSTFLGCALAFAATASSPANAAATGQFKSGAVQLADNIIVERAPSIRIERDSEPEFRLRVETPGHYERQRVLVKQGHFETYEVFEPDQYDEIGLKIPAHYESRQRWIPDMFEFRDVWVPAR